MLIAGENGISNNYIISNVRVVGGTPNNPNLMSTFIPGGTETTVTLVFEGDHRENRNELPDWYRGAYSDSGWNLVNVTFENLKCNYLDFFASF